MRHTVLTSYTLLKNLATYGMLKVSLKFHQREVTQKLRKGEQYLMYQKYRLNLIHIAINFHQVFPYSDLVMARTWIVWKISYQREETQKVRKGE